MKKTFYITIPELFLYSYFSFVLYLTLKPFRLSFENRVVFGQLSKFTGSITHFFEVWRHNTGDVVANIIMFVPLGIFLAIVFLKNRHYRYSPVIFLLGTGVILLTTSTIEFLQIFNWSRFPSLVDIVTNLIGGVTGLLLVYPVSKKLQRYLPQIEDWFYRNIRLQLLLVISGVYIAYACFPFEIAISRWWIVRHLKVLTDVHFSLYEFLNAIPYLILLVLIAFQLEELEDEKLKGVAGGFKLLYLPGLVLITILLQTICQYRYFSFSEILGILIVLFLLEWRIKKSASYEMAFLKKHDAAIVLSLYLIFMISASVLPFALPNNIGVKIKNFFIPFHDYGNSARITLIMDFFKDLFKYAFLGILIRYVIDQHKQMMSVRKWIIVISFLFILEMMQIFNKIYSPDIADIFLGIIGVIVGIKGYEYVKNHYVRKFQS